MMVRRYSRYQWVVSCKRTYQESMVSVHKELFSFFDLSFSITTLSYYDAIVDYTANFCYTVEITDDDSVGNSYLGPAAIAGIVISVVACVATIVFIALYATGYFAGTGTAMAAAGGSSVAMASPVNDNVPTVNNPMTKNS